MAIVKVLRYDGIDGNPNAQPVDMTARFNLPPDQHHNWKYIAFGPDGKLYVPFGAPCNICVPGEPYAQIRRYNPDGSNMGEPFVTGFLDAAGDAFWGRPVYLLQMPDGSLLLSDEQMGAIYRISYGS